MGESVILVLKKYKKCKMNPKNISINDYTYDLPEEKIAKYPLSERDESKLLVYQNGVIKQSIYKNLSAEVPKNSLLIFNNTKVVEARLLFTKSTGSTIEIFCLEPANNYADITTAMLQKEKVLWKCLVGGAKKWKEELLTLVIEKSNTNLADNLILTARKIEKTNDYFLIEFCWNYQQMSFAEVLHNAGQIPLPPYLNRNVEEKDKQTYQTVYAKHDGSVAAPTAGLHFTKEVFDSLAQKKINTNFVTLHVGAGTFKPVKVVQMQQHEMHTEFIEVNINTIQSIINNITNNIIAVGTTSLRTLESLYWLGVKTMYNKNNFIENNEELQLKILDIGQWDCYELPQTIEPKVALESLVLWMQQNNRDILIAKTQILIAPGYTLKIANGLITNFHQPNSTLLLLVASIVGDDWKKIYNYALDNNFRFLSYGDGSLLWQRQN